MAEPTDRIRTPCPSCGGQLFIGKVGHLTCSVLGCKSPGVAETWNHQRDRIAELESFNSEFRRSNRMLRVQNVKLEAFRAKIEEMICMAGGCNEPCTLNESDDPGEWCLYHLAVELRDTLEFADG